MRHTGPQACWRPFLHFAAALQAYAGACGAAGRRPRAPGAARRRGSRMQCEWVPCVGSPCNGALSSRVSQKNCIVKKVAVMDHTINRLRVRVGGAGLQVTRFYPEPGSRIPVKRKMEEKHVKLDLVPAVKL